MTGLGYVDMRDLDPILRKSEPAPVLARGLDLLGAIVRAATARAAGETATTPIRCPGRPRRRPCAGRLIIARHDVPSEIHWRCATCGEAGTIVEWRRTVWDLTSQPMFRGEDDGPDIELLLTQEAYDLVRGEVLLSDSHVERLVAGACWTTRGVILSGRWIELDELAGDIAFVANRTRNRRHLRLLEDVLDRIYRAVENAVPEDEVADERAPAEPGRLAASHGALQALARDAVDAHNRRPQEELGGLSPRQVQRLLDADWENPDGAVVVADDLPPGDLVDIRLLANARTLLKAVSQDGGVRMTTAENLNRAFVERMLEAMAWPEGFREEVRRYNKVINEHDVWSLHVLRILLYEAGLLRRWKGTLRATRRAEALLAEEQGGELYALLFRIHFRRFNLAYLDRIPETYEFQHTIAFSLYCFGQVGEGWRRAEDFAESLVLPVVREALPPQALYDPLSILVETRLLRPLTGFGLTEERLGEPGDGGEAAAAPLPSILTVRRYRKTALFDRFLTFRPGPA
ncbi:hypothetical protein BH18GEM1_BH18GEM1_18400 [soil metagenome]